METLKLLAVGIGMGWGLCLALSGPILVPYVAATKGRWRVGFRASAAFSLVRLLALAILGGLSSVAFASVNTFFPPYRSGYVYLIMAMFVVLMGVLIVSGKGFRIPLYRNLREHVVERGTASALILGFPMGISPCATLVSIIAYIACVATDALCGVT